MKYVFLGLVAATLMAAAPAQAQRMNADDMKWINQCIDDNKGEAGGTPQIVRAYCMCMNEKMDDNETRSITQWGEGRMNAFRI